MANNVYVGNRYVPLLEGAWDITRSYERLMIVHANDKGYISVNDVPIGTNITDTNYWMLLYNNVINITDLDWADVQNKPTTFPPSTHTHQISEVVGLQNEISAINNVSSSQDTRLTALESAANLGSRIGALAYVGRFSKGSTTQTATGGTDTILLFNKSEQTFGNSINVSLPTTSYPAMEIFAPSGISYALVVSASLYVYTPVPNNDPHYMTLSYGSTVIAQHGRQQYVATVGSTIPTATSYEIGDTYLGNVQNGSTFNWTYNGINGQIMQGISANAGASCAINIKLYRITP